MQHWNIATLQASTDKIKAREAGPDALREPSLEAKPQVLFSHDECRAVLLILQAGELLPEHAVQERAIIQVVSGLVTFDSSGNRSNCPAGTLVSLEPGEPHSVRAHEESRLLLLLAPWKATRHAHEPDYLPRNATALPR